jgi:hypothetical protein
MTDAIERRLKLFADNCALARKSFMFEENTLLLLSALVYTERGKALDGAAMKECKKKINGRVGIFSGFRGKARALLSAHMAASEEGESFFERALWACELLKEQSFHRSEHIALASLVLAKNCAEIEIRQAADRAGAIFRLIKTAHPYLTSRDDYAYIAMLASRVGDPQVLTAEAEDCYNRLRGNCFPLNSLQSLSHVLALSPRPAEQKCEKTVELYKLFKTLKNRFDRCCALPLIGLLAITEEEPSKAAAEVIEVSNALRSRRGLGPWSITKTLRLMLSAALVSEEYISRLTPAPADTSLITAASALALIQ